MLLLDPTPRPRTYLSSVRRPPTVTSGGGGTTDPVSPHEDFWGGTSFPVVTIRSPTEGSPSGGTHGYTTLRRQQRRLRGSRITRRETIVPRGTVVWGDETLGSRSCLTPYPPCVSHSLPSFMSGLDPRFPLSATRDPTTTGVRHTTETPCRDVGDPCPGPT